MTSDANAHKLREKVVSREEYEEITGDMPFYRRRWFRNTARSLFLVASLALGTGINYTKEIRKANEHQISQDYANLERALSSPEVKNMMEQFRDQMARAVNYIVKNPFEAHDIFPVAGNIEREKGLPYWAFRLEKINPNGYAPEQITERTRDISQRLHQRGYNFNEERMKKGKDILLKAFDQANNQRILNAWLKQYPSRLSQYAKKSRPKEGNTGSNDIEYDLEKIGQDVAMYIASHPELDFKRLYLGHNKTEMQHRISRKFSSYFGSGTTTYDLQRMALLYETLGPHVVEDMKREQKNLYQKFTKTHN